MIDEIEVKEILKILEQKLDRVEKIVTEIKQQQGNQSPKLSRENAAKFMQMGIERFVWLVTRGIIKEHRGYFGERYYLKDELMKVLTEPVDIRKMK